MEELSGQLGLDGVWGRKAGKLSGGWQRRVSIAMALISEPQILFLDEPTLGLDVIARHELWDVIRALKGRITVILTTHYMEEAETLSALAFVAGGMNILYQIERLPLMVAILIHGGVLYVSYLGTYLLNGWLEWGTPPILVFSVIFVGIYLAIWLGIYSATKKRTAKLNEKLKQKQYMTHM